MRVRDRYPEHWGVLFDDEVPKYVLYCPGDHIYRGWITSYCQQPESRQNYSSRCLPIEDAGHHCVMFVDKQLKIMV